MARISYIEEKDHPELAGIIGRIKGLRGGVINIYKLLLHAPALAATWFDHVNATRKTTLSGRLREIAIVRFAQSGRYQYALQQHIPRISLSEGLTLDECEALKDWRASKLFDARERALLAYVDAMAKGPEVPDAEFDALRQHFSEPEIVELTVIVGTYIMHNRVFTALRVDLEPAKA